MSRRIPRDDLSLSHAIRFSFFSQVGARGRVSDAGACLLYAEACEPGVEVRPKNPTIILVSNSYLFEARFQLYRSRFLQPNIHFSAFFEI